MRCSVVLCIALCGCAGMTPEECRTANWYEEGERDALYLSTSPRFELIAKGCQLSDPRAAERDYLEGWAAGYSEAGRRAHKPG
jgi:hypothetical protein